MITVVTPATNALYCDLRVVKRELGIDDMSQDVILEDMIERASRYIDDRCERVFALQEYLETIDGVGSDTIQVGITPIVSITSVIQNSTPVVGCEIVDDKAGQIFKRSGWLNYNSGGFGYFRSTSFGTSWLGNDRPYHIRYWAGYTVPGQSPRTLPAAIEKCCIELVKAWYFTKDADPSVKDVSVADLRVSREIIGVPSVEAELIRWRL